MKKMTPAIFLIIIAASVRIAFYLTAQGYWANPDTMSYYATGQKIVKSHTLIDPWRTPVYPIIIALPFILENKPMPASYYGLALHEFDQVRTAQSVAGVAAVLMLYLLLCEMGIGRRRAWIFSVIVAVSWPLLMYEDILVTETFSLLWLVATIYLAVNSLRRWHTGKGIGLLVLFIIGVFLRPSTIGLPLVFLSVLAWYHRTRAVMIWAGVTLVIYAGLLLTYSAMNAAYNGYPGVSRIGDVNMLGKIFQYNLPVSGSPDGDIKKIVMPYAARSGTLPWTVMEEHKQLYDAGYAYPMQKFVSGVIRQSFAEYLLRSAGEIPRALDISSLDTRYDLFTYYSHGFFGVLRKANEMVSKGYLLIFAAIPIYIYRALKKKSLYNAGLVLLLLVDFYYIAVAVGLSYSDYGRLILPAAPFLFVVSYEWCYQMLKGIPLWAKAS